MAERNFTFQFLSYLVRDLFSFFYRSLHYFLDPALSTQIGIDQAIFQIGKGSFHLFFRRDWLLVRRFVALMWQLRSTATLDGGVGIHRRHFGFL